MGRSNYRVEFQSSKHDHPSALEEELDVNFKKSSTRQLNKDGPLIFSVT